MSGKLIAWMIATFGLGACLLYIVPAAIMSVVLLAQGQMPEFSFKELASLGGFVVFSAFMSWLYVKERRENREDRKESNATLQSLTLAIQENTEAKNDLIQAVRQGK